MGKRNYECTPWGMPTYNVFGWQKPCYLLQDGYADTFQELLDTTEWQNYGTESGNPKCANCMVHSGYEASAVDHTFSGLRGLWATSSPNSPAHTKIPTRWRCLNEPVKPVHAFNPLVQISTDKIRWKRLARERSKPCRTSGRCKRPPSTQTSWKSHLEPLAKTSKVGSPHSRPKKSFASALEQAFDYRGDVTLTRKDDSQIEGYFFDRIAGSSLQLSSS